MPQHLFADLADRRSQGIGRVRCVPVKDVQKILMGVPFFRLQSASGQESVGDADGGGAAEGCSYVELIIFLKERTVNDVEDVPLMFFPIFHRQLAGDMLQLIGHHEIIRAITVFQRVMHGVHVLILQLPQEGRTGIVPRAGI